jgi:hypothetical protein
VAERRAWGSLVRALVAACALAAVACPAAAQVPDGQALPALARDVERVESLRAIKTVQRLYAQYAQYGLWSEIGDLFAPQAQFTFDGQVRQGQTMTGPGQIAAFLRTRYGGGHEGLEPGDTRLMMIEQPVVTLAPNGREATGRWAVLIFLGGGGKAAIEGGIFVNDYRMTDGRWRIAGARYFPQYAGPYETGWTNWGGGDLPIVPYHFTRDEAGVPIMAPDGAAPATAASLADLSARIRRLNDEDSVRNLQAAYGYYADRKMWDDVVDLFSADGAVESGGERYVGKDGVRRWLETMGPAGLTHGQLNDRPQFDTTVEVAPGGNEAWVRGIELGMLAEADQEKGWWEGTAFRNRFVREDGVWKLKEVRRFTLFRSDYDLGWGADRSGSPDRAPMPAFLGAHPVTGRAIALHGAAANAADGRLTGPAPAAAAAPPMSLDEARIALRRSLAYDATENVSSAYGDYLDDFQSDNFSGLLATEGFKMSAFAGYYVGRERVAEAGRRVWGPAPETRSGVSFHWRVQPVILVSDDGRSANQRVRLFQPRTGKTVGEPRGFYGAYFYSGMYHDQYVLEDGVWRMWNLSLDEPYMGTVDWKSGWQRARDPTTPPQGATSVLGARGQRLQARRAGQGPRRAAAALPRRHRRGVAVADDPADVVRVPQSGQRAGARVLPAGLPPVHRATGPQARPPRLPAAARVAAAGRRTLAPERSPDVRHRGQPVGVERMHRHDPLGIEPEPLDVGEEHLRAEHRRVGDRVGRRRQVEHVGVDQDTLVRQVADHQPVGMRQALDHVDLEPARGVLEHPRVAFEPFHHGPLAACRDRVGGERARASQRLLEEALVDLGGDDRDPFGDHRRQPRSVVEMVVRDDPEADRLARDHPPGLGDDRPGAVLVLRPGLEQHDVVGELDRERVVGAADAPHARRELLRGRGRRCARSGCGRSREVWRWGRNRPLGNVGGIGLDAEELRLERRPASTALHDHGGELEPVEVAIVRELGLDVEVAENRVLDPGLDPFDQVVVADVADDLVRLPAGRLLRRAPGQHPVIGAVEGFAGERGSVRLRALEKAPWRGPDLEVLAPREVRRPGVLVERRRRRRAAGTGHRPRSSRWRGSPAG